MATAWKHIGTFNFRALQLLQLLLARGICASRFVNLLDVVVCGTLNTTAEWFVRPYENIGEDACETCSVDLLVHVAGFIVVNSPCGLGCWAEDRRCLGIGVDAA